MSESALYNREILRLASSLVAGDRLANPDGTAEARSPICGSRIQADVDVGPDGGIAAVALRANACALGQASAAILRARAVGTDVVMIAQLRRGVESALNGTAVMPAQWPELELLQPAQDYPSRHASILLPFDAILAAADMVKPAR